MFQNFKKLFGKGKNGKNEEKVVSPIEGEVVCITSVSDPTFGEEILGKGVAIKPTKGRAVAPVSGTVTVLMSSKHAVSIQTDSGAEVLVHVGLDTIKLKGQYFTAHVKEGDRVKTGDLLLEFDLDAIRNAGYDTIVPVVVCNSDDYTSIETFHDRQVKELDVVMRLVK
ncbi:PTS glucose transporter subunit IIA [Oscillospiraceae bacterium PP1C4]